MYVNQKNEITKKQSHSTHFFYYCLEVQFTPEEGWYVKEWNLVKPDTYCWKFTNLHST